MHTRIHAYTYIQIRTYIYIYIYICTQFEFGFLIEFDLNREAFLDVDIISSHLSSNFSLAQFILGSIQLVAP